VLVSSDRGGSQLPAKARLAGTDHPADANNIGTAGIERQTGKDKTCVWRWQERFMLERVDGCWGHMKM